MEIQFEKMRFRAFHGYFEQERKIGADFLVSVTLSLPTPKAAQTDFLAQTLDYQRVFDAVKAEMSVTSKLLENVAWRISQALKSLDSTIETVKVKVEKLNPPLGGAVESVAICLEI